MDVEVKRLVKFGKERGNNNGGTWEGFCYVSNILFLDLNH